MNRPDIDAAREAWRQAVRRYQQYQQSDHWLPSGLVDLECECMRTYSELKRLEAEAEAEGGSGT